MINKKIITVAALSTVLIVGNSVLASSSDLLRMDLKKAASDDTVDVTFYTTGSSSNNTVVTRKSGNTYVVLLPNVAGNQSVVPSLGGVKDYITDVKIKNVDDGIGGYTKVTFSTTKPVKIHTYSKKTAPLTKAQQEYKSLIAQNSKYDPNRKMENFKKTSAPAIRQTPVANKNNVKAANSNVTAAKKPQQAASQTKNNNINKNNILNTVAKHTPIINQNTLKTPVKRVKEQPVNKVKIAQNTTPKPDVQKPVIPAPVADLANNISKQVNNNAATTDKTAKKANTSAKNTKNIKTTQNNKVKVKTESKGIPFIPIAGALSVVGLFVLGWFFNLIARAAGKNSNKLKEYLANYNSNQSANNNDYYNKIANDDNLSWQEKYKLYSEKQNDEVKNKPETDVSYVAGLNSSKGVIVPDDLNKRVAQMEHALSQTPDVKPPKTVSKEVQSEDDAITQSMSGLKLKSFAKHINLNETNREQVFKTSHKHSEPLKEGQFVKLKPSALSMSHRNVAYSGFNISDLVRTGRKYLNPNQEESNMSKKKEQYKMSSLNEYLDILDSENSSSASDVEQISSLVPKQSRNMMGITNPMAGKRSSFKHSSQKSELSNNISVKSKYNIDGEKSILAIELDGISAIIGKVGENISVLKKFDKVVNKPLQVRRDYGNVYIVKMGGFKCLVDVSDSKMGTLLEI